jgi:hypothetical protein
MHEQRKGRYVVRQPLGLAGPIQKGLGEPRELLGGRLRVVE